MIPSKFLPRGLGLPRRAGVGVAHEGCTISLSEKGRYRLDKYYESVGGFVPKDEVVMKSAPDCRE